MSRTDGPPSRIRLCHQDEEADYNPGRGRHVGKTARGRLFWVTTPFVWSRDGAAGRDFVALYQWSALGEFLSATIEELPPRTNTKLPGNHLGADFYQAGMERALATLGEVTRGDIDVAPFVHLHEGIEFGLIRRPPEDDGADWAVTVMPGDYMCFWAPWDGMYDT